MLQKILIMSLLTLPTMASAQSTSASEARQLIDDAIPGDLVNDPLSFQWVTYGDGLRIKSIDVEAIPGGVALQAKLKSAKPNKWDVGINVPLTSTIAKGDKVRLLVWARSDNETEVYTRFQQDFAPYNGFGDNQLKTKNEWILTTFETVAQYDLEAGKATMSFQLGAKAQSIEIGQVYITTEKQ